MRLLEHYRNQSPGEIVGLKEGDVLAALDGKTALRGGVPSMRFSK